MQPDLDDLAVRLDSLESRVALLSQQRWAAAQGQAAAQAAPEATARAAPKAVDDPVFEAAVRDVLDRIEQDKSADRDKRRAERQAQQASRWADRVAEQAGLSEAQKARVLAVAQEYLQNLRVAGESEAGALSREERNARRDAARVESEKKLAEVLSAGQLQAYKEGDGLGLETLARGGGRNRGGQ